MHVEFLLTPSDFFEPIERYEPECAWRKLAGELLGPDWEVYRQGLWWACRDPRVGLAEQGFKLHVSPDLPRAEEQLRIAIPLLARHRTAFKFVADARLLELTNSKNFSRVDSGKFITAYPADLRTFKSLALELRDALHGFSGPYVLTDRPVAGSACVFYRYGAFVDLKTIAGHRVAQALRQSDGTLVEDPREPYFAQPDWIPDPFDEPPAANEDGDSDGLLGGRFAIREALQFSNAGGVYVADDVVAGGEAILKEARPHTGMRMAQGRLHTAQDTLRSEYDILLRLEASGATPRPLAMFAEGGHLFLAQQKVSAPTWGELFSRDEISLLPFRRGDCDPAAFLRVFLPAIVSAIHGLLRIHAAGVVVGDISPNNLLVDERTHQVTFIDLEAACAAGTESLRHLVTPGFVRPGRGAGTRPDVQDDWYALGKCGLSAILPLQSLPEIASVSDEDIVRILAFEGGLPAAACDLLLALLRADPMGALEHAARSDPSRGGDGRSERAWPPPAPKADRGSIAARTASFVASQFRQAGDPAFWPVVPDGLRGNKWSIAHGAAGIAGFLERHGVALPAPLARSLAAPDAFGRIEDAGLYTGLSGIAYWLATQGLHARSTELLEQARHSPLRLRDPSVFVGDAGMGMAALSIHRLTGSAGAADLAAECAESLVRTAGVDGHRVGWSTLGRPDRLYWGFSYGSAGIAFFLAEFGLATGDGEALGLGVKALRYLVDNVRPNSRGLAVVGEHRDDNGRAMYWANGSSGIASVLLRVALQTDDRVLLTAAHRLAEASFCKYGVQCGQFDGMAGIAECMLDFASLTREAKYLEYFDAMVSGLQLHAKVVNPDQVAFAGAGNLRLACDFASGAAGVGALLSRRCGEPRSYFDFALPSANLFPLQPASDASAGSN